MFGLLPGEVICQHPASFSLPQRLGDFASLASDGDVTAIEAATRRVGQEVTILKASTEAEIDAAFATAAQAGIAAMLVSGDNFFIQRTTQAHLAAAATRHRITANYAARSYVEAGGLISYGSDRRENQRQAGLYVGRILKGERSALTA